MGGMKSGTGDDLWGEEDDSEEEQTATDERLNDEGDSEDQAIEAESGRGRSTTSSSAQEQSDNDEERPYIVRRALSGEGTQFERPNRLTFFVQDDVARGERDLEGDAERHFDTNIPTFDIREAAYRVAINNPDAVIDELSKMGYEDS